MPVQETSKNITFSRIFQIVICLVLCASIVFTCATPRAHALAVVDDIAIGIVALLLLAAAGVVFTPQISSDIGAIGSSFRTHMYQWGTSAEKLDEVEEFFGGLTLYNPGGSDDGDEDPRFQVRLARGILAGITSWIVSIVMAGGVVDEGEIAPDGYLYYNGTLYPDYHSINRTFTEDHVFLIFVNGSTTYFRVFDTSKGTFSWDELGGGSIYFSGSTNSVSSFPLSDNGFWGSANNGKAVYTAYDAILWSSFDVLSGGSVFMPGTIPSQKSNEIIFSSIHVGDLPDQIVSGEKDEDDIILPGVIDYGSIIQDGMTLEESVIDTMAQLSSGSMSHNEFLSKTLVAELPKFTTNLPITPTMSFNYQVGETADTFFVEAVGNSDGTGTLLYEWLDTSTVPYTVLGTGQYFTPDTSQAVASYPLVCRVTNRVPCSFVETGYLTNATYSWGYNISVIEGAVDPDSPPESTPDDAGSLENIQQGIDKLPGQITDGMQGILDQNSSAAENAGKDFVDDITGMIPNDSQGFIDAMGSLTSALGYTGTECVLPIPALTLPALPGLFPSYTVMRAQQVDFEAFFAMLPPSLLLLVQSLLTVALIAYCFKELYDTLSYFFVLKGGKS